MTHNTQNFTSDHAVALLEQIAAMGADDARITVAAVMEATGLRESSARGYVRHLVDMGKIYLVQEAVRIQRGRRPCEYALSAATVSLTDGDGFSRRVVRRSSWTPHHARMAMDCLLFGVPAAMQGSAAC